MTVNRARGKVSAPVTVWCHLAVTAIVISMVTSSVTKVMISSQNIDGYELINSIK